MNEQQTNELSSQKRPRGKARVGPRPGRLTERDADILEEVWRYRYLSVSQIHSLLGFPSRQMTLKRLKFLAENGYLTRFQVPGIQEQLYALDNHGAELVAERILVPLQELGWNSKSKLPSDPWFMRHFLLTSWFRIQLTSQLHSHEKLKLLGFIPEYLGDVQPSGSVKKYLCDVVISAKLGAKEKLSHTPDGVFCLGRTSTSSANKTGILFFLEIDRGTEVIANPDKGVLKTLLFYLSLLKTDQHRKYTQDFEVEEFASVRVLFVTTSQTRLTNIRTVASKFPWDPEKAKRFIWLAPKDILQSDNLLSYPWHSLDMTDSTTYKIT